MQKRQAIVFIKNTLLTNHLALLIFYLHSYSSGSSVHFRSTCFHIHFRIQLLCIKNIAVFIFCDNSNCPFTFLSDDFVNVLLVELIAYLSRSQRLLSDKVVFLLRYTDYSCFFLLQFKILQVVFTQKVVKYGSKCNLGNYRIIFVFSNQIYQVRVLRILFNYCLEFFAV